MAEYKQNIDKIKNNLKGNGKVNNYTRDYILMKHVFHCSPIELNKVDEADIDIYFNIYNLDIEAQNILMKREEQKMKNKI